MAQLPILQTQLPYNGVILSASEESHRYLKHIGRDSSPLAQNDTTRRNSTIKLKRNNSITPLLSSIAPYAEIKEIYTAGKEQGSRRLQPAHSMERRINPATTNLSASPQPLS